MCRSNRRADRQAKRRACSSCRRRWHKARSYAQGCATGRAGAGARPSLGGRSPERKASTGFRTSPAVKGIPAKVRAGHAEAAEFSEFEAASTTSHIPKLEPRVEPPPSEAPRRIPPKFDDGWLDPEVRRTHLIRILAEIADNPDESPRNRLGAVNAFIRLEGEIRRSAPPQQMSTAGEIAIRLMQEDLFNPSGDDVLTAPSVC